MKLTFIGIEQIPMIKPGDNLVAATLAGLESMGESLQENDVLVFAQKVVSKSEGRYLDLREVTPGEQALELARKVGKDPRKVQAILDESRQVLRAVPNVLIVEQRNGFVQANAGIDQSNIPLGTASADGPSDPSLVSLGKLSADGPVNPSNGSVRKLSADGPGEPSNESLEKPSTDGPGDPSNESLGNLAAEDPGDNLCLLLPLDPDKSAAQLRQAIYQALGIHVGVIINDSLGRAWRMGTLGLAIGVAGMTALEDYVGDLDLYGRELQVTMVAAADELAAGASLVMGQTTEKTPIVLVRGYTPVEPTDPSQRGVGPLLRPAEMDLFR